MRKLPEVLSEEASEEINRIRAEVEKEDAAEEQEEARCYAE